MGVVEQYVVTDDIDGTTTALMVDPRTYPPGWVVMEVTVWNADGSSTPSGPLNVSPANTVGFRRTRHRCYPGDRESSPSRPCPRGARCLNC
jgi:hypothetical protein